MSIAVQEHLQQVELTTAKQTAHFTGKLLAKMIRKFMQDRMNGNQESHRGRKSIEELTKDGKQVNSMDIKDIHSFDRVAKKYGVDYAVMEDSTGGKEKWKVFFKARDVDVIHKAFEEYSREVLGPSLCNDLREKQAVLSNAARDVTRNIDHGAR
jgi:hypothetical protein